MVEIPVESIRQALAADGEFALAARFWTATIVLEIGSQSYLLTVEEGNVTGFGPGGVDTPTVRLAGAEQVWERQLQPVPAPFYQDPLMGAAMIMQELVVEGDRLQAVYPYYAAIGRLVEVIRELVHGGDPSVPDTLDPVARAYDSPVGRYIYVTVAGVQYRVYYEEAGSGIPLLCHHTAGSDGRQYRHQLEDPLLQQSFRMIAYDLPYHGKSLPPTSHAWWSEEYRLTQDFLLEFVVEFSRALGLDRPIFMGCSVGGFLAPDLALYRPEHFRAVIGLNSGIYLGPNSDSTFHDSFRHPLVNSEWKARAMFGIMAPGAPEAYRREIAWCYSQGAPPVFAGDLYYYNIEHDLRGKLDQIDTSKTGVYIVAGEYDPSMAGDGGSRAVAEGIPGAHFEIVPQGGHFLMAENPDSFRPTLLKILNEIADGS